MKVLQLIAALLFATTLYGQQASKNVNNNCDSLVAHFATSTGGDITVKQLRLAQGVSIKSIGGPCHVEVLSYTVVLNGNEVLNQGAYLSEQSKKMLSYAKPGDNVIFEFIKIKGITDGSVRDLGNMTFTVQ